MLVPRPAQARGTSLLADRCFLQTHRKDDDDAPQASGLEALKSFVDAAAQQALTEIAKEALTAPVKTIISDCISTRLQPLSQPTQCPQAVDGELCDCDVHKRGQRYGRLAVSAQGCFRLLVDVYECRKHGRKWALPEGNNTSGCNLVGDVLGNYLVERDWWPAAIQLFTETESYVAVERQTRRCTATTLAAAFAKHPLRENLSEVEVDIVHRACVAHVSQSPSFATIKPWLLEWNAKVIAPSVAWW